VYKRLQRLKELEEIDFDDVTASNMTKKELLHLRRERDKLERSLGGIRDMARVPSAIWVVDTKKEHIAISEARKLGIPVIAILDTNCDPDEVNYPIPGNDDAIRSVALLTRVVADAVADGLIARAGRAAGEEKPQGDGQLGAAEPLAEWERELLEGRTLSGAPEANGTAAPAGAPTAQAGSAEAGPAGSSEAGPAEAGAAGSAEAGPVQAGPAGSAEAGPAGSAEAGPAGSAEPAGSEGSAAASVQPGGEPTAATTHGQEADSTEAANADAGTAETASNQTASAEAAGSDS